jgi:hypothetical protein
MDEVIGFWSVVGIALLLYFNVACRNPGYLQRTEQQVELAQMSS